MYCGMPFGYTSLQSLRAFPESIQIALSHPDQIKRDAVGHCILNEMISDIFHGKFKSHGRIVFFAKLPVTLRFRANLSLCLHRDNPVLILKHKIQFCGISGPPEIGVDSLRNQFI